MKLKFVLFTLYFTINLGRLFGFATSDDPKINASYFGSFNNLIEKSVFEDPVVELSFLQLIKM